MYTLTTTAAFDSAHFLHGYDGKCSNIHGHRWTLKVTIAKDSLQIGGQQDGMVIDFGDLKAAVRSLADAWDHALIWQEGTLKPATVSALQEENFRMIAVPFRPTAEHMAKYFYEQLKSQGMPVKQVLVYETPENCAGYEE
ncbi:MAG: 6-carboxytetrahydropterin synthase QueD [Oscillospiraceae bacterium]|nr:6-carboxytetrahydropterin synthase QueD [Oscillospiraceae bacterium]